jgi:EpsI family protein
MGLFPALQVGFWHSFSGWLIFVFCFGVLGLLNWLLNYLEPPLDASAAAAAAPTIATRPQSGVKASFSLYLVAALALVLVAGQMALRLAQAPPVPLVQSFDNFPLRLADYQGSRSYLDTAMAQAVGADAYLEAHYANAKKESLSLWIGYFESQSKKVEGRIHSPLICLTGGGWRILESRIVDAAPGLPVRYLLIERGGIREVVYYWYLQQGSWLASEYSSRLSMGWNGLIKHRNDGAIVRLITPALPDIDKARERLNAFVGLLVPTLPKFIPQ